MGMYVKEHKYYYCNFVSYSMHGFLPLLTTASQFHLLTAFLMKEMSMLIQNITSNTPVNMHSYFLYFRK